MKRILYFMPILSLEQNAGNMTRILSMLKYFKHRGMKVDYCGLKGFVPWEDPDDKKIMQKGLVERVFILNRKPLRKHFVRRILYKIPNYLANKFHGIDNVALRNFSSHYLCKQFNKILKENKYDYILINYSWWAEFIRQKDLLKGAYTIVDTHDLVAMQEYNIQKKRLGRIFEEEMKRLNRFDEVWSVSVDELYVYNHLLNNKVRLVPNMPLSNIDTFDLTKGMEKNNDIIYVASDNDWNKMSVKWFLSEVYPLLPKSLKISIIGKINDLIPENYPNITKIPFVENLAEAYANSKVAICPMLGGTGIKLKVIEAMSFALPVVCTLRGIDGLPNKINNGCLVSDDANQFASNIVELLENHELYDKMSEQGYDLYEAYFNPEVRYKQLDEIFGININ